MRSLSGRVTPGGRPVSFVRMKRVAGAAVAFGALMVLAVGSVSSATRAAGALTGHIVFTRAGGEYGDETVYVANADGTGQRRITKLGASGAARGQLQQVRASCSLGSRTIALLR
jgi:hypothetical protein